MTAEAFRKQRSRARQRFAEALVKEVSRTIANVTPDGRAEELLELDVMRYVRTLPL